MRKFTFIFFLLASYFLMSAQDCSEFFKTEYDEFTGETLTYSTKVIEISENEKPIISLGFGQLLDAYGDEETKLLFILNNKECINNGNGIIILFEDTTSLKLTNHGKSTCDGVAYLLINLTIYDSNTGDIIPIRTYLEEKKVKALRIYTNNNIVQVFLSKSNQSDLINKLKCLKKTDYK